MSFGSPPPVSEAVALICVSDKNEKLLAKSLSFGLGLSFGAVTLRVTLSGLFWHTPFWQLSSVQALWSSQLLVQVGGGGGGGAACQPDTLSPNPGSETMTDPSSLTRAVPPETNCSRS